MEKWGNLYFIRDTFVWCGPSIVHGPRYQWYLACDTTQHNTTKITYQQEQLSPADLLIGLNNMPKYTCNHIQNSKFHLTTPPPLVSSINRIRIEYCMAFSFEDVQYCSDSSHSSGMNRTTSQSIDFVCLCYGSPFSVLQDLQPLVAPGEQNKFHSAVSMRSFLSLFFILHLLRTIRIGFAFPLSIHFFSFRCFFFTITWHV